MKSIKFFRKSFRNLPWSSLRNKFRNSSRGSIRNSTKDSADISSEFSSVFQGFLQEFQQWLYSVILPWFFFPKISREMVLKNPPKTTSGNCFRDSLRKSYRFSRNCCSESFANISQDSFSDFSKTSLNV